MSVSGPGRPGSAGAARGGHPSLGPFRQHGLGKTLLGFAVQTARQAYPGLPLRMSAQAHLVNFYKAAGFQQVSEPYLEDGIPHIEMLLAPGKDTPYIA